MKFFYVSRVCPDRDTVATALLYSLRTHTSAFLTEVVDPEVTVAPRWSSKQALTILVASAVAMKNRMDLAINVAVGSSIQVALLIGPLLVFLGVAFGQRMDLVSAKWRSRASRSPWPWPPP